jgi:hypothetical protein
LSCGFGPDGVDEGVGAWDQVIADILFDEAVAVVAADPRVGQVHVFDPSLQLAAMMLADSATEDHADFVGLPDRSVGIEQSLAEAIQYCTTTEDEVVAEFDLREEQPMLTARFISLFCREERHQPRQPFLAAGQELTGIERICKLLLEAFRRRASDEGVGTLLEVDD